MHSTLIPNVSSSPAAAHFHIPLHTFLSHTLHIIHSALIPLLLQLHVITQLKLSPTQVYRSASLPLLAIAPLHPTFTTPLLLCLPTSYQHNSHFLIFNSTFLRMAHTLLFELTPLLRPQHPSTIPYFVQLLSVFTRNMMQIVSIFASYLFHLYIISTPFQLFAIRAILIIFMFSSHRLPFHSNSFPPNHLKDIIACLNPF